VICELCGQDRVREDTWHVAFLRWAWPPVKFARACQSCREKLPFAAWNRALFFFSFLALFAAVAAAGAGIVLVIQWLIRLSSS